MNLTSHAKRILLLVPILMVLGSIVSIPGQTGRETSVPMASAVAMAAEHSQPAEHGGAVVHEEEAVPHEAGAVEHETAGEAHGDAHGEEAHGGHGPKDMAIWWVLPFVGILLSIAVIPLISGHWWHHNFPKVSLLFGLPMAILMFWQLQTKTIHVFVEYCSFIALVGSLFVISGGILIRGSFKSTPLMNCIFLAIGSVIASLIGTAGASMVLIRPMLRINANRKTKLHIFIFFIFMVSNIGGSLTPLGDPPLFLGFLQGVPFQWTLIHMLPGWAFMISLLLVVFFIFDTMIVKREGGPPEVEGNDKFAMLGGVNFLFLVGVMTTVIVYGSVLPREWGFWRDAFQVGAMTLMAALSMIVTPKKLRDENGFTWFPVKEVAILFAAIFACMIPALNKLEYMGLHGQLVVEHPWQYFWMAGTLSSFLDNAPTYLTFLSLGKTMIPVTDAGQCILAAKGVLASGVPVGLPGAFGCVPQQVLLAISMGAVFMGANTYIGNAPNFMVKSICEENKVPMPSFLGYMGWSIAILVPLFVLVTFVFFGGF